MGSIRNIHNASALLALKPYETEVTAVADLADELSELLYVIAADSDKYVLRDRARALALRLTGEKGDD